MVYDLGDASKWEFMFSTMDKPLLCIPAVEEDILDLDEDEVNISQLLWLSIQGMVCAVR